MTKVWIKYDPFVEKTEFTVNDAAIDQNSGLYKYLDTPVEDWVDRLFPALVEHCNDDEIEMTFKGFLHYFQLLESVHAEFSRKNTEYDIELHYESSPSPTERKENLLKILAEIRQMPEMEDVLQDTALNEPMPVAVLGGTEEQRNALIEMIPGAIEPVDAEAAIHENLVLYLLAREWRQNDQQHMEWIAEQFRAKTKHRRRRFLFIAEDVSSAVRMLNSEAGIKKAEIFSLDEKENIKEQICLYKTNVFTSQELLKEILHSTKCLEQQRDTIYVTQEVYAHEKFYSEAIQLLDDIAMHSICVGASNVNVWISDLFDNIVKEIENKGLRKKNSSPYNKNQANAKKGLLGRSSAAKNSIVSEEWPEQVKYCISYLGTLFLSEMMAIRSLEKKLVLDESVVRLQDYLEKYDCTDGVMILNELQRYVAETRYHSEQQMSLYYYTARIENEAISGWKFSTSCRKLVDHISNDVSLKKEYVDSKEFIDYFKKLFYEKLENTRKILEEFYINAATPPAEIMTHIERYKADIQEAINQNKLRIRQEETRVEMASMQKMKLTNYINSLNELIIV